MRKLNKQECDQAQADGAGYLCFMGGVSGSNGKMIVSVGDETVLFEKHEIGNEEYNRLKKLMEQDCKDYMDGLRYLSRQR